MTLYNVILGILLLLLVKGRQDGVKAPRGCPWNLPAWVWLGQALTRLSRSHNWPLNPMIIFWYLRISVTFRKKKKNPTKFRVKLNNNSVITMMAFVDFHCARQCDISFSYTRLVSESVQEYRKVENIIIPLW